MVDLKWWMTVGCYKPATEGRVEATRMLYGHFAEQLRAGQLTDPEAIGVLVEALERLSKGFDAGLGFTQVFDKKGRPIKLSGVTPYLNKDRMEAIHRLFDALLQIGCSEHRAARHVRGDLKIADADRDLLARNFVGGLRRQRSIHLPDQARLQRLRACA
jgi:hypothetical protein